MVPPPALIAMRKAAALAFAVPGVEIDLRSAGELVARVHRRGGRATDTSTAGVLCPAAFRSAVGRLVSGQSEHAEFLAQRATTDLGVDLFMPFTGAAGSLGMVVARLGEILVHVFATTRPPSDALIAVADAGCHPAIAVTVNASWDELTRVTLVHAESRTSHAMVARPHIEAMMNAAFFRLAVDEIAAAIAEPATRPATRPATEKRQDQP